MNALGILHRLRSKFSVISKNLISSYSPKTMFFLQYNLHKSTKVLRLLESKQWQNHILFIFCSVPPPLLVARSCFWLASTLPLISIALFGLLPSPPWWIIEHNHLHVLFLFIFSLLPSLLLVALLVACHLPPRWVSEHNQLHVKTQQCALLCQQNLWMTRERQQSGNKIHDTLSAFALPPSLSCLALSYVALPCSLLPCLVLHWLVSSFFALPRLMLVCCGSLCVARWLEPSKS